VAAVGAGQFPGEGLQLLADHGPVGQPQGQSRARERVGGEDVQVTVEVPVVKPGVLGAHEGAP
jgi:hypothetical protein